MKNVNPSRLSGRYALVTGASRGIGRAVARRFAAEGAVIAINHHGDDASAEECLTLVKDTARSQGHSGQGHTIVAADVSQLSDVKRVFDYLLQHWAHIDIVVNNAGIQDSTPATDFDPAVFHRIMAVNLLGAVYVSSAAVRHFLTAGTSGVIINTSSVHETIPKPGFLAYSISKGGMGNLTRTMALEFASRGIRVNAVAPGAVLTDINRAWTGDAAKRQSVERHIPMGRAADPDEVAPLFAFLASDEAAYITGQTIYACGGLTLYGDFAENWSS